MDDPVLPERSRDDSDRGWGDEPDDSSRDQWLKEQRPPHHGD